MTKRAKKRTVTKTLHQKVWGEGKWNVQYGELKRGRGRPRKVPQLFKCIGEKLPYGALDYVEEHLKSDGTRSMGVYIAHDSMGTPRYVGRGSIFHRLRAHKKSHSDELAYFSFYVVEESQHEREIETLMIRAAGESLAFNARKKRVGIRPGDARDFEPGTQIYERQAKRGRRKRRNRTEG